MGNIDWCISIAARNAPVVPVVIEPILARRLRPHQIEGVFPKQAQALSRLGPSAPI